jgi:CRP-like cAMP-binding protein
MHVAEVETSQSDADTSKGCLAILERASLLFVLGSTVLSELAKKCRRQSFERRATVHRLGEEGRGLHVIGRGRVRLVRTGEDDRELTLAYRGPGSLIGEDVLLDGRYHAEVRAAEPVEAAYVPLRLVERLIETHPRFGIDLLRMVVESKVRCERRLQLLLTRPVESRVADFLVDAVKHHGIADSRGQLIAVKFTHLEIASFVGSTRETVTLVLGDLKRRGIIEVDQRRVVVCALDRLRGLV